MELEHEAGSNFSADYARARIAALEAALREAMELHRIAVVYVLAATPRTERTDYIDRLAALDSRTEVPCISCEPCEVLDPTEED